MGGDLPPTRYALICAYFYEKVLADTGCIFIIVSRIEKRPWGLDKPRGDLGDFHRSDSMKSGLKWLPDVDSAVCKTIFLFLG